MKLLVLLPALGFLAWWLVDRMRARPWSRGQLRAGVGLLVGVYLLAAASLGLFWVARMELPVFDWHYLVGYLLLAAAAWHFYLELPQVRAFFRPRGHAPQARPLRRLAPRALWVAGAFLVLAALLLWRWGRAGLSPPAGSGPLGGEGAGAGQGASFPPAAHQGGGDLKAREAIAYLLRESAASPMGLVRRGLFFGPKVSSVRVVDTRQLVLLPAPSWSQGRPLAESLRWLAEGGEGGCGPSSLMDLGTLLAAGAGVTEVRSALGERLYLRAAPSAGALYPGELYLVTAGVGALPAGVYAYVPQHHALWPLPRPLDPSLWQRSLGGGGSQLASGLVLSAVFQRTVWKYASRSYRYVVLDGGHMAANLLLAGASLGVPVACRLLFADEEAEKLVGAEPREEGVLALFELGRPARSSQAFPAFAELELGQSWEGQELTRLSHALTRWRWYEGEPRGWLPPSVSLPVAIPRSAEPTLELIARRRSFRRFSSSPLAAGTVERMAGWAQVLLSLVPGGEGMGIRAVLVREQTAEPGVYHWQPDEGRLRLVRLGHFGRELYRAGLSQELLARAAAALVFTLDEETLARWGRRGLRLGLFAAGMAGELVYLAAEEAGLGACGVGAFVDEELARLLQLPATQSPVYLVALGRKGGES